MSSTPIHSTMYVTTSIYISVFASRSKVGIELNHNVALWEIPALSQFLPKNAHFCTSELYFCWGGGVSADLLW